jgi:hypothetical protein
MITVNIASSKYEVKKFNDKNFFSLAEKNERFFDLMWSLQHIIGKGKKNTRRWTMMSVTAHPQ